MMALKIVDNCLEKIRFADLVKDAKTADDFSPIKSCYLILSQTK